MTVVGNGLAPFRLVVFAEGVKPLPYKRWLVGVMMLRSPRRFAPRDDEI